jgi:hypothetical protein
MSWEQYQIEYIEQEYRITYLVYYWSLIDLISINKLFDIELMTPNPLTTLPRFKSFGSKEQMISTAHKLTKGNTFILYKISSFLISEYNIDTSI